MSFNSNHSTWATINAKAGNPDWLLTLAQVHQSPWHRSPLDSWLFFLTCTPLIDGSRWHQPPSGSGAGRESVKGRQRSIVFSGVAGRGILKSLQVHLAASIWKAAEHSDVGHSVHFHGTGSGPWNPNGSSQRPGLECDSEQFPRAGFHACIHLTNIYWVSYVFWALWSILEI